MQYKSMKTFLLLLYIWTTNTFVNGHVGRVGEYLKIAFAFVGQFMRHDMVSDVREKYGNNTYSAYIATSNLHSELNYEDFVDQRSVCSQVIGVGFMRCVISVEPYNAERFMNEVGGGFQFENKIYPYRIASFFSTIFRSLKMIENDEKVIGRFDAIVITRFDVHFSLRVDPMTFWTKSLTYDMVGTRGDPEDIDDKFFYGPRDSMMIFRDLYDNFDHLVNIEKCGYPERCIFFHAIKHHKYRHVGRVIDFVTWDGFHANQYKYAPQFLDQVSNASKLAHHPQQHGNAKEKEEELEVIGGVRFYIKSVDCTSKVECGYGETVHVLAAADEASKPGHDIGRSKKTQKKRTRAFIW